MTDFNVIPNFFQLIVVRHLKIDNKSENLMICVDRLNIEHGPKTQPGLFKTVHYEIKDIDQ